MNLLKQREDYILGIKLDLKRPKKEELKTLKLSHSIEIIPKKKVGIKPKKKVREMILTAQISGY